MRNVKSRSQKQAPFRDNTGHPNSSHLQPAISSETQAPLQAQHSRSSGLFPASDAATGTTIHALLLLVDHVNPGVRKYALLKLRDHLPIWRIPVDRQFAGSQEAHRSEMVMEDMPHADDVVALVKQLQAGDTNLDVREAAQVIML